MKTLFLAFVLGVVGQSGGKHIETGDSSRFAIYQNGKFGFIDKSGTIVIEPVFQSAQDFSEALCAVRSEGRYGFIDVNGRFVISPGFDYATTFMEGVAVVYVNGAPRVIDKKGVIMFNYKPYKSISDFHNGRAVVQTYHDRSGIIDRQGRLIVDTLYRRVYPVGDGLAIVHGPKHEPYDDRSKGIRKNPQVSLVDSNGKQLFPFGIFESIKNVSEGYLTGELIPRRGKDEGDEVICDLTGKVLYKLPSETISWFESGVNEGVLRISASKGKSVNSGSYERYIRPDGTIVYDNKRITNGTNFHEGRAFCQVGNDSWVMIDSKGEVVSENRFDDVMGHFENGLMLAKKQGTWCLIDRDGHTVYNSGYENVNYSGIVNGYFFPSAEVESDSAEYPREVHGIVHVSGKVVSEPRFQWYDERGFVDGMLRVAIDDRMAYVNTDGKVVWHQEAAPATASRVLNIDYMNRGYFYAGYHPTGHTSAGDEAGWERLAPGEFPGGKLTLTASRNDAGDGIMIRVANTLDSAVWFNAQDSRIPMKLQALDANGQWRDIEYLPNSWCGNSYHTTRLPADCSWRFTAPEYQGCMRTRLRAELRYINPARPAGKKRGSIEHIPDELVVHSNEFEGSVNPGQFWRRPSYSPGGLMDPYNE